MDETLLAISRSDSVDPDVMVAQASIHTPMGDEHQSFIQLRPTDIKASQVLAHCGWSTAPRSCTKPGLATARVALICASNSYSQASSRLSILYCALSIEGIVG